MPSDGGRLAGEQHLALDFGGLWWNDEGSALGAVTGYVTELQVIPEPAISLRNKFHANGGWLASLTVILIWPASLRNSTPPTAAATTVKYLTCQPLSVG